MNKMKLELLKKNSKFVFEKSDTPQSYQADKNALLIIPDLELNGAQTVMYGMTTLLQELSYGITVISSEDGPYREKYTEIGATVSIRPVVSCPEEFKTYMREFDLVYVNSSSCIPYLYYFINTDTPVLLWLHETEQQLLNTGVTLPPPQLLSPNIHITGVTKAVLRGIKNLYQYDIPLLPMPVFSDPEYEPDYMPSSDNTVEFFIPAGYTYIKGQDILLKAISMLPKEMTSRSHFTFCGYKLPGQEQYYSAIKEAADKLENVSFLDKLDQQEVYELYKKTDCVVAPSRIDATPTTIVEALMFGRIALVSSNAGISEYLQDCVNAFVFTNEDELFKRLLLIISDVTGMEKIRRSGHQIYNEYFSKEAVKSRLTTLL